MSKLVDAFKNYVKKSEAATAASRAEMEARGQVNPFLEEKPTEAELQQLIDLGGKEMTYPMIDYIKKWRDLLLRLPEWRAGLPRDSPLRARRPGEGQGGSGYPRPRREGGHSPHEEAGPLRPGL